MTIEIVTAEIRGERSGNVRKLSPHESGDAFLNNQEQYGIWIHKNTPGQFGARITIDGKNPLGGKLALSQDVRSGGQRIYLERWGMGHYGELGNKFKFISIDHIPFERRNPNQGIIYIELFRTMEAALAPLTKGHAAFGGFRGRGVTGAGKISSQRFELVEGVEFESRSFVNFTFYLKIRNQSPGDVGPAVLNVAQCSVCGTRNSLSGIPNGMLKHALCRSCGNNLGANIVG